MALPFILLASSALVVSSTHAAAIPYAANLDSTAGTVVQSHSLSTEALLTLIGVCVAVFGTALTLVLSWPSLKITWGRCTSQRRSRPVSTADSAFPLVQRHGNLAAPAYSDDSWTRSLTGGEIPQPQRVQSGYTEQQRALMRRTRTM